jgi:hypothetical protein
VIDKDSDPVRWLAAVVTDEMIRDRAWAIAASGAGGSPIENWFRAAQELRHAATAEPERHAVGE